MKYIFLPLTVCLYIIPSFSEIREKTNPKAVVSDFIKFLNEKNYEGCVEILEDIHEFENRGQNKIAKKIKKAMKKAFQKSYNNGDNIFHLFFRLGQPEMSGEKKEHFEHSLRKMISFAYYMLGSEQFLKLLTKENTQGASPVEQVMGGPYALTHGVLKSFFIEHSLQINSGLMSGFNRGFITATGVWMVVYGLMEHTEIIYGGAAFLALGGALCYKSFQQSRYFQKVNSYLSSPVVLPH